MSRKMASSSKIDQDDDRGFMKGAEWCAENATNVVEGFAEKVARHTPCFCARSTQLGVISLGARGPGRKPTRSFAAVTVFF
jgi:hypothetical protein